MDHEELSPVLCDELEGWAQEVGGRSEGRGYKYTCSWFTLLSS